MEADLHLSPERWHSRHSPQVWQAGGGGASQVCFVCEHWVAGAARTEHRRPGPPPTRHSLPTVLAAGSQPSRSQKVGFLQKRPRLPTQSHCEAQGLGLQHRNWVGQRHQDDVFCFPLILLSPPVRCSRRILGNRRPVSLLYYCVSKHPEVNWSQTAVRSSLQLCGPAHLCWWFCLIV